MTLADATRMTHTRHPSLAAVALLCALASAGCQGTDEAHCPLPQLDSAVEVTDVEVTTTTGEDTTDSDIFLVLEAADGSQSLYLDDPATNNFAPYAVETFVVPVTPFLVGDLERMIMRKESSFLEGGDWDLDALTVTLLDAGGQRYLAYDNQDGVEHMTGDETTDLHCL